MKPKTPFDFLILLIDLLGLWILIFCPITLAMKFENLLYLLTYLIFWIPGGLVFGLAGWLINLKDKKRENKDV